MSLLNPHFHQSRLHPALSFNVARVRPQRNDDEKLKFGASWQFGAGKCRQTQVMQNQDSEQLLVKKSQIARRYNVSERTIQQWMQKKIIPFLKIGYVVRLEIRSCDAAVQQCTVPMAQDFYSLFDIGTDDKHIAPIDEGGVALAAIQGLNEKLENGKRQAETQIEELKAENSRLKEQMVELRALVLRLTAEGRAVPPQPSSHD